MAKILQDVWDRLIKAEKDIKTIELGVYGDSKNEVKGLIQTVRELRDIVKECKDDIQIIRNERKKEKLKIVYFGLGAGFIISGIFWIIKLYFNAG